MPIERIASSTDGAGRRVGIVLSRFNAKIGETLLAGALHALRDAGVAESDVTIATVPGALETPLALQRLAQTRQYDALVALGAVIRGETYHFEIVSNESSSGISSVQLETGVPIANGILTTENDDQALARMMEKGADCAMAAIEMANLIRKLEQ